MWCNFLHFKNVPGFFQFPWISQVYWTPAESTSLSVGIQRKVLQLRFVDENLYACPRLNCWFFFVLLVVVFVVDFVQMCLIVWDNWRDLIRNAQQMLGSAFLPTCNRVSFDDEFEECLMNSWWILFARQRIGTRRRFQQRRPILVDWIISPSNCKKEHILFQFKLN